VPAIVIALVGAVAMSAWTLGCLAAGWGRSPIVIGVLSLYGLTLLGFLVAVVVAAKPRR
jgi:hypothetical protein